MKNLVLNNVLLVCLLLQACNLTNAPTEGVNSTPLPTRAVPPTPLPGTETETIQLNEGEPAHLEYPDLNYQTGQEYPPLARIPLKVSMNHAYYNEYSPYHGMIQFSLTGPNGETIVAGTQFREVPISITVYEDFHNIVYETSNDWNLRQLWPNSADGVEGVPSRYEFTSFNKIAQPGDLFLTAPEGTLGNIEIPLPQGSSFVTITLRTFSDIATKSVRTYSWSLTLLTPILPKDTDSPQPEPTLPAIARSISNREIAAAFGNRLAQNVSKYGQRSGNAVLLCPGETYDGLSFLSAEVLPSVYQLNEFINKFRSSWSEDIEKWNPDGIFLARIADPKGINSRTNNLLSPGSPGSQLIEGWRQSIIPYRDGYLVIDDGDTPAVQSFSLIFKLEGQTVDLAKGLILIGDSPTGYVFGRLSCN